jgi:hypothetical protein
VGPLSIRELPVSKRCEALQKTSSFHDCSTGGHTVEQSWEAEFPKKIAYWKLTATKVAKNVGFLRRLNLGKRGVSRRGGQSFPRLSLSVIV